MKDAAQSDPKRMAILKAAFEAFAAYGYRRTAMADIARAAGVSRPALYMHFTGKDDIFRALAQFYYDDAAAAVADALNRTGRPDHVLEAAFLAQSGQIGEALLNSPHGDELLDTGHAVGADIAEMGEARLAELYAAWLEREAMAERLRLPGPAPLIAHALVMALKGLKAPPHDGYIERVKMLARILGRGLAR
ncbi:TetR/AcrR family transcriptional regulator [Thalassococcus sp. CAU 1522]|uniref:TetR/AcrR family transcriptional regulator n=1 Tax=Thalassococcus arenae TaxID=2851652 RepID=A0ABS6NBI6_9RHOB|nr:TetR/AcrR family transcriptional regulator [Thalassococcus arenae]MBV2361391.1 TetR/AcrR family transcriptional regulator [Thalassococcus arenae]